MTKHIIVVPYDKNWPAEFEKIKCNIEYFLKDMFIAIEHVGSTSVEGLSAKPVIDIDIVIKDYMIFPDVVKALETAGYLHEGDLGIKDREAFMYMGNGDFMMHHLYVCPSDSQELERHLKFRDYLRNSLEAVGDYSRIKEAAAAKYPFDIDGYLKYKGEYINKVYKHLSLH